MSDPSTQIKAKLLLEELNRRNRWFVILRSHRGNPWGTFAPWFVTVSAGILTWGSFGLEQTVVLFVLISALSWLARSDVEGIHRRVDALVELLQQEGMFQSPLPVSPQKPQGQSPADGAHEPPPDKA
jgi:hypothetical protein